MRLRPALVPLSALVVLALVACGGEPPAQKPQAESAPVNGGTAVYSTTADFDAFNGFVSTDYDTSQVLQNMLFMPLLRMTEDMGFTPYLADSFWMADDGSSISFRIRDGVRWTDGEPTTVDDVLWSYRTYTNPELAYANSQYFQFVKDAVKVDDRTIRFDFTEPHSDAPMDFTGWTTLPEHLLKDVPVNEMRNADFNRDPVGNGPFKLVSWTANQEAVFEANPDFVLGRPRLDRLVVRIIPEQTTELTELLTGGVDLVRAIPPAETKRVEERDGTHTIIYPSRSFVYLAWNTRDPLFRDPAVRRAMTMAIDRQQIVNALLYGYGEIVTSDVLPFQWQHDDAIQPWPYDPERAKQILAEAGWTDTDGDGILDKDGKPFRFTLETNQGNDLREDILVIIQADLKKIGVDVQPRLTEWNTLISRLKRKEFTSVVSGWVVDFKFDPTTTMSCKEVDGPYNYPSYCNPKADSLMEKALRTLDRDEAKPIWDQYQEVIHQDQPYTFLYALRERLGVSDRLMGVKADARGHMITVHDWWIPENRRRGGETPVASNR